MRFRFKTNLKEKPEKHDSLWQLKRLLCMHFNAMINVMISFEILSFANVYLLVSEREWHYIWNFMCNGFLLFEFGWKWRFLQHENHADLLR